MENVKALMSASGVPMIKEALYAYTKQSGEGWKNLVGMAGLSMHLQRPRTVRRIVLVSLIAL